MACLCPPLTPWLRLPSAGGWQQAVLVPASSTNTAEPRPGPHGCHWDVQGGDLWAAHTQHKLGTGPSPRLNPAWVRGAPGVQAPDPLCFGRLCSPMPVTQLSMLHPPSEGSCSSSSPATCGGSELESCRTATQLWPLATGRGSPALLMPPSRTLWAISGFSKVRAVPQSDGSEMHLN